MEGIRGHLVQNFSKLKSPERSSKGNKVGQPTSQKVPLKRKIFIHQFSFNCSLTYLLSIQS